MDNVIAANMNKDILSILSSSSTINVNNHLLSKLNVGVTIDNYIFNNEFNLDTLTIESEHFIMLIYPFLKKDFQEYIRFFKSNELLQVKKENNKLTICYEKEKADKLALENDYDILLKSFNTMKKYFKKMVIAFVDPSTKLIIVNMKKANKDHPYYGCSFYVIRSHANYVDKTYKDLFDGFDKLFESNCESDSIGLYSRIKKYIKRNNHDIVCDYNYIYIYEINVMNSFVNEIDMIHRSVKDYTKYINVLGNNIYYNIEYYCNTEYFYAKKDFYVKNNNFNIENTGVPNKIRKFISSYKN